MAARVLGLDGIVSSRDRAATPMIALVLALHLGGALPPLDAADSSSLVARVLGEARTRWLMRFADQAFSLVDAVSFEIMRRERLTHAFAFDPQFEVAGFKRLTDD